MNISTIEHQRITLFAHIPRIRSLCPLPPSLSPHRTHSKRFLFSRRSLSVAFALFLALSTHTHIFLPHPKITSTINNFNLLCRRTWCNRYKVNPNKFNLLCCFYSCVSHFLCCPPFALWIWCINGAKAMHFPHLEWLLRCLVVPTVCVLLLSVVCVSLYVYVGKCGFFAGGRISRKNHVNVHQRLGCWATKFSVINNMTINLKFLFGESERTSGRERESSPKAKKSHQKWISSVKVCYPNKKWLEIMFDAPFLCRVAFHTDEIEQKPIFCH